MSMAFIEAMTAMGLPSEHIPPDGQIHRLVQDKDCWAINHGDVYGVFGDFSRGISGKWIAQGGHANTDHWHMIQEKVAKEKEQSSLQRQQEAENVALVASQKWNDLMESGSSSYLERKQVGVYDIRFSGDSIVIPLRDTAGRLWSMQTIQADGTKRFLSGGRKKGCFHVIGTLEGAKTAYICEGYATAASIHLATQMPVIVALDAGNLKPVLESIKTAHSSLEVIIAADNDCFKPENGNVGKEKAEEAAKYFGCKLVLPVFRYTETKPTDFNDLHTLEGLEAVKKQLKQRQLNAMNLRELLEMDITPTEMLLHPIIPKQGLGMLYAYRGRGKTFFALGIAYALITGGSFLKWKAARPHRVLLVDGEMTLASMQQRFSVLVKSNELEPPSPDYLRFITPDMQDRGIPSIHTAEGQQAIEEHLLGVEVVIFDNISTLCRNGRENEADSWNPIQEWALYLRRKGISVLFIHHSGKNEQQRGTAKREDVLDTVIALKSPKDYEEDQGLRVEVHYEKHRYFFGEDAKPFEAQLNVDDNTQRWQVKDLEDNLLQQVKDLQEQGLKQREIAETLSINLTKVNRLLKKAKEGGQHAIQ